MIASSSGRLPAALPYSNRYSRACRRNWAPPSSLSSTRRRICPANWPKCSMPRGALDHVAVDHCVGGAEIGPLLVSVARQPATAEDKHPIPDWLDAESQIAEAATMQSLQKLDDVGVPSRLSCPECGGVMYEMKVDDLLRFRCRVGHAYSSKSLLADQTANLEASLWAGVRALEESALLMERLSERVTRRGGEAAAADLRPIIEARKRQADDMRRFIKTALSEASSSAVRGT